MKLVVSGLLNKQVAGELGIGESTVKAHRGQVMQKMNADAVADLVKMTARLYPSADAATEFSAVARLSVGGGLCALFQK